MRFRIEIDLPTGKSAEFVSAPPATSWSTYLDDALAELDVLTREARQWIESQRTTPTTEGAHR